MLAFAPVLRAPHDQATGDGGEKLYARVDVLRLRVLLARQVLLDPFALHRNGAYQLLLFGGEHRGLPTNLAYVAQLFVPLAQDAVVVHFAIKLVDFVPHRVRDYGVTQLVGA